MALFTASKYLNIVHVFLNVEYFLSSLLMERGEYLVQGNGMEFNLKLHCIWGIIQWGE